MAQQLRARPVQSGSTTTTEPPSRASSSDPVSRVNIPTSGTLQLRGESSSLSTETQPERRVQWAEDVVNNEGMGKKRSKVCCIYHKPREVGESSSDESSSSESDSDSDCGQQDDGAARPARHSHPHDQCGGADHNDTKGKGKQKARRPSPNAYEKQPKYNNKH